MFGQRQHAADMVAAGQLRHHAAIGAVHVDLAVQCVRQQLGHGAAIGQAHQGHARFVTGGFDTQDQRTHGRQCRTCGAAALAGGHWPGLPFAILPSAAGAQLVVCAEPVM
jgi:hypothetical protein